MLFFKTRSKPGPDSSDRELEDALDKAYIRASRCAQKKEIVYGNYSPSMDTIRAIKIAKIALKGGNRRLAIDFLTKK